MGKFIKGEHILIVDDSEATIEIVKKILISNGYKVHSAFSVAEAIKILEITHIDLVITDLIMPKVGGLDLVRHVMENFKNTEVMMITGYATVEGAVKAIKAGATDYLAKPFTNKELLTAVYHSLEKLNLRLNRINKNNSKRSSLVEYGIIGESSALENVYNSVAKAALAKATVLITGESGTGKELVARSIHYSSNRASYPFVAVNCGGIPEGLLESELFGHKKGSFTGAIESRPGFFQTADGGSIFLDEISETSPAMQVKLLRVLQEKEVCMVGSSKSHKIDVRIIAASNKDLISLIDQGLFREDLYFRLNVININVPPLRKRDNDVLLLIKHFISKFSNEIGKEIPEFSNNALSALQKYFWPGNVRELENVIQSLIIMTDSNKIQVSDLPSSMRYSVLREKGHNKTLAEAEAVHIQTILMHVNGNKTKAATILKIDRKTLREKVKRYKIDL